MIECHECRALLIDELVEANGHYYCLECDPYWLEGEEKPIGGWKPLSRQALYDYAYLFAIVAVLAAIWLSLLFDPTH